MQAKTTQQQEDFARCETLESRDGPHGKRYALELWTEGWALAGADVRWDAGYYGAIVYLSDGARHGQRFGTLEEAKTRFDKWTANALL